MAAITDVSIRRPVATAMAFLILLVLGVVSFRSLPVDLLPKIEYTELTVTVGYPNVGPEEVEQIITDRLENAVAGLPNLERMTSQSEEGRSRVRLHFARGTHVDEAANDLRAALDRVRDELPTEAETPRIFKLDLDQVEVVSLAATSTHDLERLTRILEDELSRRFEQIAGVGAIQVRGGIYRQIRVDLDRDRLKAAGLTALDVEEALARENVTLPAGNVRRGFDDLYVRALGEYRTVEQIARTVVASRAGKPIRVRDVAAVEDGYDDVRYMVEMNGVPSLVLGIQKQSGANTVAVADAILAEIERINAERDDVHLTVVEDQSEFIRRSIDTVRSSALWGSLLAVCVLYYFLRNASSTGIIALSIPISVIATFALLYFGGLTLNQMTFGGLALGVGLIVDNAIVVLESIVRKREEAGEPPREAARIGAREVAGAIVASTLTTCVIFLPVVFSRTTSGALFQSLALVVVFALACSLLVALTLVPMLAARFLRVASADERERSGFFRRFRRLEGWYTGRLQAAMRHRGLVFATTGGLLAAVLLLWPLIPVELAPQTDANEIDISLDMARGTNIAVVRSYVDELEDKVRAVVPAGNVRLFSTEIRGDNAAVELKLVPQEQRAMPAAALADLVREAVDGEIPGAEIRVEAQQGLWMLNRVFSSGGGDDAVEVELRGWDLARADRIAADMRRRMEALPGVTDVRVSRREGQPEERLVLDRERIAELGLAVREVGRTLLANVAGAEAGRFREGGEEFPIMVRLRQADRLSASDLDAVSLRTAAGDVVPLSTLVERQRGRGPVEIDRVDGQRVTYVTANLESGVALGDAVERVQAALAELALPPGYSIVYGGQYQEQLAARRDFLIAIVMALVLVYMLMAAQFERFVDPLIVMAAVPMALVGVVPVLLLTGTTLNIQSVMGLVMLIGIVVNNAIVLVDTINLLRRDHGMAAADAVLEGARLRLRPILMTTATTALGLLPLAIGIGTGAEIQAALARVVIGGLVASTLVTLVLIPVAYAAASGLVARIRASRWLPSRREESDDSAAATA
ncbi:MAG TPA: efflux RND transporter permease subunit [Thermoanaerobaculia bacterium]|nr:efflux RND transporter permease subunit [Thermoanaerobaculia bacterium]